MKSSFVLLFGICSLCLAAVAFGQESAPAQQGLTVEEAKLGTAVENKALVGEDSVFTVQDKVYLWMKVTGGPADSIAVTWKHGADSYETKLNIGGSPWRTWAYKTAWQDGEWTVTITSAAGDVLKEMSFMVKPAEPPKQ